MAVGRPCGFGDVGQLVCAAEGACGPPPPIPAGGRCVGNRYNCADDGFTCLPAPVAGTATFPAPPGGGDNAVCLRGWQSGESCGAGVCGEAPFETFVAGACVSMSLGKLLVGAACGPDLGLCVDRGDGSGSRCVDGVCVARAPPGSLCVRNDDCSSVGLPAGTFTLSCVGDAASGDRRCRELAEEGVTCGTGTAACFSITGLVCDAAAAAAAPQPPSPPPPPPVADLAATMAASRSIPPRAWP